MVWTCSSWRNINTKLSWYIVMGRKWKWPVLRLVKNQQVQMRVIQLEGREGKKRVKGSSEVEYGGVVFGDVDQNLRPRGEKERHIAKASSFKPLQYGLFSKPHHKHFISFPTWAMCFLNQGTLLLFLPFPAKWDEFSKRWDLYELHQERCRHVNSNKELISAELEGFWFPPTAQQDFHLNTLRGNVLVKIHLVTGGARRLSSNVRVEMPIHRLSWLSSDYRAIHLLFNIVYILQESNG